MALRAATLALGPYLGSGPWLRVCVCDFLCVCKRIAFHVAFCKLLFEFCKSEQTHTHTHTRGTHTHTLRSQGTVCLLVVESRLIKRRVAATKSFMDFFTGLVFIVGPLCCSCCSCHQPFLFVSPTYLPPSVRRPSVVAVALSPRRVSQIL